MQPAPDANDTPWYVTAGQAEARRVLAGFWLRVIADEEGFHWDVHRLPPLDARDVEEALPKVLELEAGLPGPLSSGDVATYDEGKAAAEHAAWGLLTRDQRQVRADAGLD